MSNKENKKAKLLKEYNTILRKYFDHSSLKKEQYDIINSIVNLKKDVCSILSTGFGKSICYQMPYLITKKCVIVISPLIALMTDQENILNSLQRFGF